MKIMKLLVCFILAGAAIMLWDYMPPDFGERISDGYPDQKPKPASPGISFEGARKTNPPISIFQNKKPESMPEKALSKYNNRGVCVLLYHCIAFARNNGLKVPPEQFEKQMKYLRGNNYTTLTVDQLYSFMKNNEPIPRKSVVITFDDGYIDNYTYAYPILKEYGLTATIFVITNKVDQNKSYMTSSQLRELEYNGIDIQSHTLNHEQLDTLPYRKQARILSESKEALENILGTNVSYIAYPYGKYNKDTIRAAKEAGYKMGFVTGGNIARKRDGVFTLRRLYVVPRDGMDVFTGRLKER